MSFLRSVLPGLCLLAAPAAAQTANFLWIYPTENGAAATFVNRPAGGSAAEGLVEFNSAYFRGIGDTSILGDRCEVGGLFHYAADEDTTTVETYDVVLRTQDPNTMQPDPTTAGLIASFTGLSLPTNAAGGRSGWIMTDTFGAPVAVPCDQTFYAGLNLAANANWPASDGQSIWACYKDPVASGGTVGQNPRAGSPDLMWSVAGAITTLGWTGMVAVMVDSPVFQVGGIDPNTTLNGPTAGATDPSYGLNGLFPDLIPPRGDGLTLRVKDTVEPFGVALFTLADTWFPIPMPLGFPGAYRLDLGTTVFLGFAGMSGGIGELPVVAPGAIPQSLIGTSVYFQGAVFGASGTRLGNGQAVTF